ncbi:MAG: L-seryl-tRNA(Sec) selenium transferase [Dehalococcoidales bacterium]|nr:L-seryl-tRNA(Sec) selenium transferase [Dehalococcoidales bacterium]
MDNEFRKLPSVDKVLSDKRVKLFQERYPHDSVLSVLRRLFEDTKVNISKGNPAPSFNELVESAVNQLNTLSTPGLRPVINATGVLLHTNLGRAPLSRETIEAMAIASRGYSNLEFDLESGNRGSRQVHIESLLSHLTGAESALVVNNNAGAVLLGLSALARRKEVIVSRGQAVEIGGGFRVPDVMRQSNAKLVEVGTTNCTYIKDYEQAINEHTVALLRVHSSNFKVVGFTSEVDIQEMTLLAAKHNLITLDDLGSGCFLDTAPFGLAPEPTVQNSISAGVDLVFFSGDKLVGGPQAGIIIGRKELVDKLKKHPLARTVRIDKVRLAGLAATLMHYLKGEAIQKIPVWRMMATPLAELEQRANLWAAALGNKGRVIDGESMVGGGSLPGGTLPTKLVAIGEPSKKKTPLIQQLAASLRQIETPVVGRISENMLLLDPRSVLPEEDKIVIKALKEQFKIIFREG